MIVDLKKLPFGSRICIRCDLCSLEDASHMIMQCPLQEMHRVNMYNEITTHYVLNVGECTFETLLSNYQTDKTYEDMLMLWGISSYYIFMMYRDILVSRKGVG